MIIYKRLYALNKSYLVAVYLMYFRKKKKKKVTHKISRVIFCITDPQITNHVLFTTMMVVLH